jgi:uncharacterized protein (DUF362 family)
MTRRDWVRGSAAAAAAAYLGLPVISRADAPTAPVSVVSSRSYAAAELRPALEKLFDQLNLGKMVSNKTVSIKINLTGNPTSLLGSHPIGDTTYTNPYVIGTVVSLLGRAGAKRIRLLESPTGSGAPIPEFIAKANWDLNSILNAAKNVELINTNFPGENGKYVRMMVPTGGYIWPGFDLHPAYKDCDVFMSLAKMKEHATAGITLSMKNCFGMTPCAIYGNGAGVDEPSKVISGGRQNCMHTGTRAPSKSAPQEVNPTTPREGGYRMPRIVTDVVSARPIDIAIVEAVHTMAGSEIARGSNDFLTPGLIIGGTNCVTTDAVCVGLMGYDPMSDRGTMPFERCDNTLALAEAVGMGTRDLKRIEVRGVQIADARLNFGELRKYRPAPQPGQGRGGRGPQGQAPAQAAPRPAVPDDPWVDATSGATQKAPDATSGATQQKK